MNIGEYFEQEKVFKESGHLSYRKQASVPLSYSLINMTAESSEDIISKMRQKYHMKVKQIYGGGSDVVQNQESPIDLESKRAETIRRIQS